MSSTSLSAARAPERLRTGEVLDRAAAAGRPALIGYLPVGFPDLPTSTEAVRALIDAGTDIIELGLPYSDPVMDGPVIQEAAARALAAGTRTRDLLGVVDATSGRGAAIAVMSYWNPILAYGVERFAADLAAAGGAGLITPDLIPDEAGDWIAASDAQGLDRIFLVAPASPGERLEYVSRHSRGFVYAASTMGVTGARGSVSAGAADLVRRTREAGAEHVCVGLGVSTRAQAAEVGAYADGVIVGSAFVRALRDGGIAELTATAREIRAGIDEARS